MYRVPGRVRTLSVLCWCCGHVPAYCDLPESMKLPCGIETGSMVVVETQAPDWCDEPAPRITSGRIVCFPAPRGWRRKWLFPRPARPLACEISLFIGEGVWLALCVCPVLNKTGQGSLG
jgi:hypothetical protein